MADPAWESMTDPAWESMADPTGKSMADINDPAGESIAHVVDHGRYCRRCCDPITSIIKFSHLGVDITISSATAAQIIRFN